MKFLLIAIAFFFFSCKKEKSCEKCIEDNGFKNAMIVYSGPVQGDGCEWLVRVDSAHLYHPDSLEPGFQHDQLEVKISYEITSQNYICGIASISLPVIHVVSIKL